MIYVFAIADRLQVTIDVVLDMTIPEFYGWLAYSKLMSEKAPKLPTLPRGLNRWQPTRSIG